MTNSAPFFPRMLSASEYVLALHSPEDRVAVLVRNRTRKQTMQRILAAEAIASPLFLYWLIEQNDAGADIFIGMNPIKENSYNRTKENIREVRHVYLDLDEGASASLHAIRTSGDIPTPNFVLDTSPEKHQVIWRVEGLDQGQAESLLRSLATAFRGDICRDGHIPCAPRARIRKPKVQRAISGARDSGDGPDLPPSGLRAVRRLARRAPAPGGRPRTDTKNTSPDTEANPKRIGPTQSARLRVATLPRK